MKNLFDKIVQANRLAVGSVDDDQSVMIVIYTKDGVDAQSRTTILRNNLTLHEACYVAKIVDMDLQESLSDNLE